MLDRNPGPLGTSTTTSTGPTDRSQVLSYEQVDRLRAVLDTPLPIHGRGDVPTLLIRPRDLVRAVRDQLKQDGVRIRDIRLNGGAASYVLGGVNGCSTHFDDVNQLSSYNDLDLIFRVRLSGPDDIMRVKEAVLATLPAFLPDDVTDDKIARWKGQGQGALGNCYVHKLVKIFNEQGDRWSLISLSNVRGRSVELKFSDVMRRQFQFSVDSFQIILDSLLTFYDAASVSSHPSFDGETSDSAETTLMTEHFYPTVFAESVYGRIATALDHLRHKLIVTRRPEEIRGGGLLKYCSLLVRGYRPLPDSDVSRLERYMCSRFFIDFPSVAAQRMTLENYLAEHFVATSDRHLRLAYLATLGTVINASTVCLMGHDRQLTLMLVRQMSLHVLAEQQQQQQQLMCEQLQDDHMSWSSCSDSDSSRSPSPQPLCHVTPLHQYQVHSVASTSDASSTSSSTSGHSVSCTVSTGTVRKASMPVELRLVGSDGQELVVERICYGPFTLTAGSPTVTPLCRPAITTLVNKQASSQQQQQHFYTVYTYQVATDNSNQHNSTSPTVVSSACPYFIASSPTSSSPSDCSCCCNCCCTG